MAAYEINQYGEVYPIQRRAQNAQCAQLTPSNVWQRHWAWYQRRGCWGKVSTITLLWPSILVISVAIVAVVVIVLILIGLSYAVILIMQRLLMSPNDD